MPILDAIGIVSADIAKSLQFYKLLGVDVPTEISDHVEAVLPSGLRLMFDSVQLMLQIDPDWKKPTGQSMGLAFLCDSPSTVDEVFARCLATGFAGAKEPWDAFWGQRYAQVYDPDGNKVDLFAAL